MKGLVLALASIFSVTALFGQENHGYNIIGKIKGLPDDITFYLITNKPSGSADTLTHTKSKNQQFSFKGVVPLEAELHFIKMDTSVLKLKRDESGKKRQSWVRLLLDNSTIHLTGDVEQWPKVDIKGSIPTEEHDKFIALVSPSMEEYNSDVDSSRRDSSKLSLARIKYNQSYIKALEAIPNSYAIPLFILNNKIFDLDAKEAAYNGLSPKLKNSFYGERLKQTNRIQRAGESVVIGKTLPDFDIKMAEGSPKSIKSIIAQSKFTLIDFWASWCVPCRKDIPNLKKVYETFNEKGFNILSISIDSKLASWKKALSEENMPWDNGLEQNQESKEMFNIGSIPAQILVNDKAEIIAIDYNKGNSGSSQRTQFILVDKDKQKLRGNDLFKFVEGLVKK